MDFKNNKYKYKAHPKWKNIEKKLNGINIKIKKDFIFIKANQSLTRIKYYKISCIKGLKDYVKVYANVYSIKYFEQKIPLNDFIRINKSYIISIDRIEKIEFNHVFSRSVKYQTDHLAIAIKMLNSILKKYNGKRAKEFIDEIIIHNSKKSLIESPDTIKQLIFAIGFTKPTNFNKFFKKYNAITPLQFKEQFNKRTF